MSFVRVDKIYRVPTCNSGIISGYLVNPIVPDEEETLLISYLSVLLPYQVSCSVKWNTGVLTETAYIWTS